MKKNLIIGLFFLAGSAFSAETMTPIQTVQLIYNQLQKYDVTAKTALKQKAMINKYWMFEEISRDAIVDQWDTMNPDQQKKYLILMKQLLEKTIYEDTGDKLKKGIAKIVKQQNISSKSALVKTRITTKKNNLTVSNNYTMSKQGTIWMVRAIFIDGSNLAEDYRSQYNQIAKKYGIEGTKDSLLERIENSLTKEDFYNIGDEEKKKDDEKKEAIKNSKPRPSLLQ